MNDETLKLDIIKAGGYAYPQMEKCGNIAVSDGGMTLRDAFAKAALMGACANSTVDVGNLAEEVVAATCYRLADAMLAERVK